MVCFATRPEFPRHIRPSLSRDADAGGCRPAAGMQRRLRNGACRSMAGKFSHRWMALAGPCVAGNDGTLQSVTEPRGDAVPIGTVVMQVFM